MSIETGVKEKSEINTTLKDNKNPQVDFDARVDVKKNQDHTSRNSIDFDKRVEVKSNEVSARNNNAESKKIDSSEKMGGSYGEVYREGEGDKYEVHHMPADSVSYLERNDGPAIKMEKGDHRQTASCGCSKEAREYRETQKELIEKEKFKAAVQMDIDDIHSKFGNKYDKAISQMLAYVNKLEAEGKIDG